MTSNAYRPGTARRTAVPTHATGFGRFRYVIGLIAALLLAGCTAASAPQSLDRVGEGVSGGVTPGFPAPFPTGAPTGASNATTGQRIAWTGSLQLQVADLNASLSAARAAVTQLDGFVSASRRNGGPGGDRPVASVTYRIPSARWEDGLAALRKLALKVLDEQTDSADLATQIVDVEARLRNLRASETSLQQIARQATRITDVLEVETRLTQVRGEIESLAAQQAALTDRVALGTLTVTFGTEVVAVTEAAKQWDPTREVDAASASLISFLQQVASAAIWFAIVWLPVLLVGLVIVATGIWVTRRLAPRLSRLTGRPQPAYPWTGGGGWTGPTSAVTAPGPGVPPVSRGAPKEGDPGAPSGGTGSGDDSTPARDA